MAIEKKVIVVDDEYAVTRLASRVLKPKGYSVLTAGDGEGGVKLYRENIETKVLLLDEDLPGISGTEAIREIREIAKAENKMPYIFSISGREIPLPEGANELLQKPFTIEALYKAVERGFGENEAK